MANLREIRGRIKSVKNTRQITRAMELVAASKMKKAQQVANAGQPYAALLAEALSNLADRVENLDHPYLQGREVKTRGILVVTSDKGLCGALNGNIFREIAGIKDNAKFVNIGKKGKQYLGKAVGENLLASFEVADTVPYLQIKQIIEFMIEKYEEGVIDTIEVIYPHFVNTLIQETTNATLLPIRDLDEIIKKLRGKKAGERKAVVDERKFKFEPDPATILASLLPLYINREAYQAVLSAKAAEHSSRMVAMKSAKDNANKLIDSLTLEFNKARQAAITQEILEIAAATASNG
ncbi:ATP synthase F1 subunit gamma [Puniceicoccaceae bacterium K14]|nr:ATP synthase F1 subunit gamma [Puniceicoccaceae bacterium K14]